MTGRMTNAAHADGGDLLQLYFPVDGPPCTAEGLEQGFSTALQSQPHFVEGLKGQHDGHCTLHLNYEELVELLPSVLLTALGDQPTVALPSLALALHQLVQQHRSASKQPLTKVVPRLCRFEPTTPLRNIKSNFIGKFVAIRGTVVRVGNIKPMVLEMDFKCSRCDASVPMSFKDGKFKYPVKCSTANCRSKSFNPDHTSAVAVDWQKIRIQEQMDKKDPGRVPRTIECELSEDLVDSCVPGDIATVCGIVKVVNIEADKGRGKDKNKSLFQIYIDVNSLENNKQVETGKMDLVQFQDKDLYAIQEIANEGDVFQLIVNSLCPGIFGHEMVKAGLALTLFGGCQKFADQKSSVPVRGDPHILIVGDPGLGKSQMLGAVTNIAPRGVYVCGSYSSSTGLTVTLLKEAGSGDYALEAGALVLADQGSCCIDEFDKMSNEHPALMEAMEQQSISIAKAGIVCNLPARTSVIAAANPVGGHYNRAKTVSENLKMNGALLSRFDLIFILLDKPDEERDQILSEHVMAMHGGTASAFFGTQDSISSNSGTNEGASLLQRLKVSAHRAASFDPIHPILLRKYIAYARKFVFPKLSEGACKVIQEFYLSLREKHRSADTTPITTRQLESLIRLSEARARLELREEVTEDDARDIVEIMKESLFDRFEDEYGNIDFRRSSGMSKSKDVSRFIAELQRASEQNSSSVFTIQQLYQISTKISLQVNNFEDFIETLNTQNYLLKKGPRSYKLMTSSYR